MKPIKLLLLVAIPTLCACGCKPRVTGDFGLKFGQNLPDNFSLDKQKYGHNFGDPPAYFRETKEFPPFQRIEVSLDGDNKIITISAIAGSNDVHEAQDLLDMLTQKYGPPISSSPNGHNTFLRGRTLITEYASKETLSVQYADLNKWGYQQQLAKRL